MLIGFRGKAIFSWIKGNITNSIKSFSKEIRVTDSDEIKDFNEFILISEKKEKEELIRKGFVLESEDSFNKFLPFFAYRFRTNQM